MFSAYIRKVFKKIERGSLDLIPSPIPSVKIQIMGRKICLRCKGETLLGVKRLPCSLFTIFKMKNLTFRFFGQNIKGQIKTEFSKCEPRNLKESYIGHKTFKFFGSYIFWKIDLI